jgi:hypothetical protein
MEARTVKLIGFILLLVHGIGHFQGVAAGLGLKINDAVPAQSWLLKGLGSQTNSSICLILFLVTGIIGILTALSFWDLLLVGTWQKLALVTATLSTVCLILFPNAFAMFFNKIGAIGVNLLIYYSILFHQQWPAAWFES